MSEVKPTVNGMSSVEESDAHNRTREINARYFSDHIEAYKTKIQVLDTYQNIRYAVDEQVRGIRSLIDIGNGGVFDYDTTLVESIVAFDVCFEHMNAADVALHLPVNAVAKAGDAVAIPFPDGSFDGSVIVMVLHHLVGNTVAESKQLTAKALSEAYRVLKPGGKLVLVESCVPGWVYLIERLLFAAAAPLIRKITKHPPTLQYTAREVTHMLANAARPALARPVRTGRWVVIYGLKVPTVLTPVTPYLFVVEKPALA